MVRYLDYLDNTFGSQTYLQLGTSAAWEQIRDVLKWQVDDYFSQLSIDNLAGNVPSNTEDINAFNLGAELALRLADRHTVTIRPSFQDYYYEATDNDNRQAVIDAEWSYQLGPTVALSLQGTYRDVNYDNDTIGPGGTSPDYTGRTTTIGVDVLRARAEFNAAVGISRIDRDTGADTDGVVASLAALYRLSGRSSVNALLSSDFTDSSSIYLGSSINPNTGNYGNVQTSSEALRNTIARVGYTRDSSTSSLSAWVELRELDYDTSPLDRKVQEYGARLAYSLTSRLTTSVTGRFVGTEEEDLNRTDRYYQADGQLGYDLSRKLNARAGVRFQNRSNTDPLVAEYDEYSIFAGLDYRLGR
jgi:hypothetical protein